MEISHEKEDKIAFTMKSNNEQNSNPCLLGGYTTVVGSASHGKTTITALLSLYGRSPFELGEDVLQGKTGALMHESIKSLESHKDIMEFIFFDIEKGFFLILVKRTYFTGLTKDSILLKCNNDARKDPPMQSGINSDSLSISHISDNETSDLSKSSMGEYVISQYLIYPKGRFIVLKAYSRSITRFLSILYNKNEHQRFNNWLDQGEKYISPSILYHFNLWKLAYCIYFLKKIIVSEVMELAGGFRKRHIKWFLARIGLKDIMTLKRAILLKKLLDLFSGTPVNEIKWPIYNLVIILEGDEKRWH